MYPIILPDPEWTYICQAYSGTRRPMMTRLSGLNQTINSDYEMLLLSIELYSVLRNGYPAMVRFHDWVRQKRMKEDQGSSASIFL